MNNNGSQYTSRLKALLKLAINRLKLLQQKKTAINKQNRRNLSQLLEAGKIEACRIRIENLWQEDVNVELLEILELYCELILARSSRIVDQEIRDQRVEEAVHVLLYAAQYVDVKELANLRPLMSHMVTKEYVEYAIENTNGIPDKIIQKIHVDVPSAELVDSYMLEICKAYEISVPGIYEAPERNDEVNSVATDKSGDVVTPNDANESAQPPTAGLPSTPSQPPSTSKPADPNSTEDLWARFAALKK
ncbi:Ist1 protein [Starmerella bacillaris]|uniref:Ist1 protein n=1 Tax=Starmerella bacillaris TaxID=1247836 RepID=A0AAV5RCZ4_STABA|nr:Ist1 protein [Starmerella bacillaris]